MANYNLGSAEAPTVEVVKSLSEATIKEVFVESNINDFHTVMTGIQYDKQIAFVDGAEVVGQAIAGCVPELVNGLNVTERTWTPKLMGGRVEYCATDESTNVIYINRAKNVFPDFFNRNSDVDYKLLASIVLSNVYNSIMPKAWFSDTAADTFTGGGVFTDGTTLGIFNQFDGLFKQIFADSAIPRHTITKNAGADYDAQKLADDEALTILKDVYLSADVRLRSNASSEMYVTQSIYDNLLLSYADKGIDSGLTILQNGLSTLTYLGKAIKVNPSWDYTINTYQNNGTKHNKPHRVVFTVKTNVPIGTLSSTDLNKLEYKYDDINNKNIIDFGYFLDAKVLRSDFVSVAY